MTTNSTPTPLRALTLMHLILAATEACDLGPRRLPLTPLGEAAE